MAPMTLDLDLTTAQFTRAKTIADMLRERAANPRRGFAEGRTDMRFLFVPEGELPPDRTPEGDDGAIGYSWTEALEVARRGAAVLHAHDVRAGDRVLLMLPTGPSFLAAFHGCQLLGAIPVPVVPPVSLQRMEDHLARIARIAKVCEAKAVVVGTELLPVFKLVRARDREARRWLGNAIRGSELLRQVPAVPDFEGVSPEAPAMIQFTSGSTGDPKGVVLPHRSLLANMLGMGQASGFGPDDCALAWLPLFHDMGLIGHFLCSMAWGIPLVLLPPDVFVKRPREWLKAISRYKGTASAAPNFAFSLCVRKIRPRDMDGIDLSSWRVAYCGAEPVNPETVREFIARFEPHGFHPSTFFPVYGMAEFSLAASFPVLDSEPRFDRVQRHAFERSGKAIAAAAGESRADTVEWVSVGRALPGHEVRIVDASGQPLGERLQGEVEVRGPSMMSGYWNAPVPTAEAIRDGWLRTGDLGYIAEGDLFVTGRRKEMIIKGGKNLYPQDIEAAAARVPGVRVGCIAAFGVKNEKRGTEDLVIVCETRQADPQARARMASEVRARVLEGVGVSPDVVELVGPGVVPKTSSGKIQRDLMRQRWQKGDLRPGTPSFTTMLRLQASATLERVRAATIGRLRG